MSIATAMIALLWVLARPYDHVLSINTCNVEDDTLLMLIVDDAPGVARIRVAALQGPVLRDITKLLEPTKFGAFVAGPVEAGTWRNGLHGRPSP